MLYSSDDYKKAKHKIGLMPVSEWNSKSVPKKVDTTHLDKGVSAVEMRDNPDARARAHARYRLNRSPNFQDDRRTGTPSLSLRSTSGFCSFRSSPLFQP